MIEILDYVFQSFWHWFGTLVLLIAIMPWNRVTLDVKRKERDEWRRLRSLNGSLRA